MKDKYDAVVVGSGIAGLSFALKLAEKGYRVCIITKKQSSDSNTNYAQGGIACVQDIEDSFDNHVRDTFTVGDELSDKNVIQEVVEKGPKGIKDLIAWGVEFCKNKRGDHALGQEGGHSHRRILHVKDMTGRAIEKALIGAIDQHELIDLNEHCCAIDLITSVKLDASSENKVLGIYVLDTYKDVIHAVASPLVVLATGGIGQLYPYTTNPEIATGDGIGMAYRAGAVIQDMEFIQFHPTSLYAETKERFLISEAVRGEGAKLLGPDQKPFMHKYDSRKELAPRDIVARAIDAEMKSQGADHVWLDLTHLSTDELKDRFPSIYERCLARGIDVSKSFIPVVPAAHYLCGGIKTTLAGQTNIPGLYACGEVASTGLHGANRLASNSLLEAVVMGAEGSGSAAQYLESLRDEKIELPEWVNGNVQDSDEKVVLLHNKEELKRALWDYVGIVRTTKRLLRAKSRIQMLSEEINEYYWNFKVEPRLLELRNMILVAQLIIESALKRKESRGLHCIQEFPDKESTARHTCIIKNEYT